MKLQVWWIPQVPMEKFEVQIDSLAEGVKILNVLADYDIFQYENNIKPDYCNAGGIIMYDEAEQEWIDWYDELTGEDDPEEFLKREEDD